MRPVLPSRHRYSRSSDDDSFDPSRTPSPHRAQGFISSRLLRSRTGSSSTAGNESLAKPDSEVHAKGPLGLTTVYQPADQQAAIAQIVFVHGLGGDSERTWSKNDVFWPRDLLPIERPFERTAIHSFGYASNFKKSSILDMQDFSNALLQSMLHSPVIQGSKSPIILIAHSMGGLVIKKTYISAKKTLAFAGLAERIKAMFFIATPHSGSTLAPILDKIFRLSSGLKPYLEDIKSNSEAIQAINAEFPWLSTDLLVYSFFETSRISLGGLREVIVVPKEEAVLNYPHEKTQLLYGDHRSICKYESIEDPNFITLWQALAAALGDLSTNRDADDMPLERDYATNESLCQLLDIWEPPDDELLRVTTDRLRGTCRWLLEDKDYSQWCANTSTQAFWLRGPPGSGKSYIAGSVIEQLQEAGERCCYYFFNHSDKTKSSLENFFLSMTWQMAINCPIVGHRILEICQRDPDIARSGDYRTFQRKFWEQGIFQLALDDEIFWVIDAFDECEAGHDLARFMVRVQEKSRGRIKIFVTTRNAHDEYHISSAHVRSRDIMLLDTQTDIASYLDAYKHEIPGSSAKERETLRNQILEKSNGCFLWAILVLQRLGKTVGAQARLRALEELPPGMDQLYSRIVQSMSQNDMEICMTILTWTVCAVRPLTTEELKSVIEETAMDKIDDIELIISKHCHDLVFIDKASRVRMRHASTRKYFLRQDINSDFEQNLTIQETEAHKLLAMTCLTYLNGPEMKAKMKRKMVASSQQRSAFANYACTALPYHIVKSQALDSDITSSLASFLQSNILTWIEHLANQGDLETVLQFANVLKSFLRRKSRVHLLLGNDVVVIDSWADDLIRVVSKFGRQILSHPESILTIIPPFCPPESSIFTQFARSSGTIVSVAGLSTRDWDDCLCTAVLSDPKPTASGIIPRERLHSLASLDNQFCIGTSTGRICIFNERTCIEESTIDHGQPVLFMEQAASKPLLASAGRKTVRIWNSDTWEQQWEYSGKHNCLAMAFVDDDKLLLVVLSNNTLMAVNLIDRVVEETCWTDMLEEPHRSFYHNSSPQFVSFNTDSGLLAIAYRSRKLLVYNYERESYQIFDHQEGLDEGITQASAVSIYSLEFSRLPDTSLLAVSYSSSDLVLFDTEAGTINLSVPKSHYSHLVSSPDGRTLAAATRDGTIELFDFETLHKLYRIRSDGGAVSVMRFAASNTRLLVIRAGGHDCRVWSPATLFRRNVDSNSVRSPSLGSGSQDGVYDEPEPAINPITAIAPDTNGGFFLLGKGDYSVSACDTKTGLPLAVLFSHTDTVRILHSQSRGALQLIFSIDASGILMAHKVVKKSPAWNIELLYTYRGPLGRLKQLLCRQDLSRILLGYSGQTVVLDAIKGTVVADTLPMELPSESNEISWWARHPTDPTLLLHISTFGIDVHSWSDLGTVQSKKFEATTISSQQLRLHSTTSLFTGPNAAVLVTFIHPPYGPRGPFSNFCYGIPSISSSEAEVSPLPISNLLCDAVDVVLGTYRERMVFLHSDGWICSIKAAEFRQGSHAATILYHFSPPAEWLLASKLLIRMTITGDIMFVVKGEVAVVRRGLERFAETRRA
ncbi:hypothetical protein B0I35DRAFT_383123 [Stachybotrys elegans]|uniref:GPI inositol-deacylase n=1 Tax=Stachybotrys elegans TaxID=80388 RepID=A0A8K0WJB0_9HYPO|nr:hypothetical protein B0I35DRAFT_383123 [Stachybotrys elegans]